MDGFAIRCTLLAHPLIGNLDVPGGLGMRRLSNGTEEAVTVGDANRPLAVQAATDSLHANRGHAMEDPMKQRAPMNHAAAQGGRHHQNGHSPGEPSTSGRPEQLTCRLVVDCMVMAIPGLQLPWDPIFKRWRKLCTYMSSCSCLPSGIAELEYHATAGSLEPHSAADTRAAEARRHVPGGGGMRQRIRGGKE